METNRNIKQILQDSISEYNNGKIDGYKVRLKEVITSDRVEVSLYGEKRIWKEEAILSKSYVDQLSKDFFTQSILDNCYSLLLHHLLVYAFKGEFEPKIKINN